jgi:hypothetical protein
VEKLVSESIGRLTLLSQFKFCGTRKKFLTDTEVKLTSSLFFSSVLVSFDQQLDNEKWFV